MEVRSEGKLEYRSQHTGNTLLNEGLQPQEPVAHVKEYPLYKTQTHLTVGEDLFLQASDLMKSVKEHAEKYPSGNDQTKEIPPFSNFNPFEEIDVFFANLANINMYEGMQPSAVVEDVVRKCQKASEFLRQDSKNVVYHVSILNFSKLMIIDLMPKTKDTPFLTSVCNAGLGEIVTNALNSFKSKGKSNLEVADLQKKCVECLLLLCYDSSNRLYFQDNRVDKPLLNILKFQVSNTSLLESVLPAFNNLVYFESATVTKAQRAYHRLVFPPKKMDIAMSIVKTHWRKANLFLQTLHFLKNFAHVIYTQPLFPELLQQTSQAIAFYLPIPEYELPDKEALFHGIFSFLIVLAKVAEIPVAKQDRREFFVDTQIGLLKQCHMILKKDSYLGNKGLYKVHEFLVVLIECENNRHAFIKGRFIHDLVANMELWFDLFGDEIASLPSYDKQLITLRFQLSLHIVYELISWDDGDKRQVSTQIASSSLPELLAQLRKSSLPILRDPYIAKMLTLLQEGVDELDHL